MPEIINTEGLELPVDIPQPPNLPIIPPPLGREIEKEIPPGRTEIGIIIDDKGTIIKIPNWPEGHA